MGDRGEDKEEEEEVLLCGLGVYQYLGIQGIELDNCENPRILTILTSILDRAIDRNGIDLAKLRNNTKLISKNTLDHTSYNYVKMDCAIDNSDEKYSVRRFRKKPGDNVGGYNSGTDESGIFKIRDEENGRRRVSEDVNNNISRIDGGIMKNGDIYEDNLRKKLGENVEYMNRIDDGMIKHRDSRLEGRRNVIRQKLSMFDGMRAPSIGVESYIQRINKYARCSPCCYVMAYAYLIKISASLHHYPHLSININNPLLCFITPLNIHRLLITSIMLAAKFMDDSHFNNAYFAKIGGVSTMEMNGLEMAFLKMVEYRLHISPKDFEKLCSHFGKESAMQAILMRPPPPPPPPHPSPRTLHCSFHEERDRKLAHICTHTSGL